MYKKAIELIENESLNPRYILANNCRGFDHVSEYGKKAVIDCVQDQLGKIQPDEIENIVRFQYKDYMVQIDTYTNCYHKEVIIPNSETKEFSKHNGKSGMCFFGDIVSSELVTKESAAKLHPKAFNKKGYFCQFTFKPS